MWIINNLFNLTLVLLGGCIFTAVVCVVYIIRIMIYGAKERRVIEIED